MSQKSVDFDALTRGKFWFVEQRHCVRTHPVIKVLRSFFKSDPPVILRPQACGALRAMARWFISLAPPPSRERTLWLKLTFHKSIPLSLLLGVCRFFFVKRGAKKNLSKRNAGRCGAGRSLFEKSSAKTFDFWRVRTLCPSPTNQNLKLSTRMKFKNGRKIQEKGGGKGKKRSVFVRFDKCLFTYEAEILRKIFGENFGFFER